MSANDRENKSGIRRFRAKLLIAMMLVVAAMTVLGLFLAERKVAIEARLDLLQDFQNELATVHGVQEVRNAALAERCRALVMRPRLHAALEDNALDLLYPTARDELRELVAANGAGTEQESSGNVLSARFYRFLDSRGAVIPSPSPTDAGAIEPSEEAELTLPSLPETHQIGYACRKEGGTITVDEVIAMPIRSSETGDPIAALVLGLKPVALGSKRPGTEIRSGTWLRDRLHLAGLGADEEAGLGKEVSSAIRQKPDAESSLNVTIAGAPYLLFYKQLNPNSFFSPAYEVAVYALSDAIARQQKIRSHVLIAGAALLAIGLLASHLLSMRLSRPVEKLAVTSEHNLAERVRAEAALESTSVELQRSVRFSADASHQLKTPVTVLRAGIDELLARENFSADVYDKLSALLHQTYRITGVIDDLLLLSRMDAGRLRINFENVNLSQLLEEWIDDLSALPDDLHVKLETNFPPDLHIAGERRFVTLIVQNLLENARKYNVPGGSICVFAREEGDDVILCVENTSRPIPPEAQEHIFERFHRGGMGENIPGHGLGLNLARELARLHGGDLRLVRSDQKATEFEVRFKVAKMAIPAAAASV
jgi:signal transduction histidine kinase